GTQNAWRPPWMTSWSIRPSAAVLVPSLARIPRLPWLCRSLLHHAASARRGQNRATTLSCRRLDRRHLEGVHVAVVTVDRDIFAVAKRVIAETITGLLALLPRL